MDMLYNNGYIFCYYFVVFRLFMALMMIQQCVILQLELLLERPMGI